MVAQAWPDLLGSQQARIQVVPAGEEHPRWQEISEYVARSGTALDPWQQTVLHTSFLERDDLFASFTVGVCAPRQNGKNGITEMRELVGAHLLGEELVIHTAHLADTSKEAFRRLDDIIDANEWISKDVRHIWRTNGHEAIEFRNGCRIRFRTRTRGGGRGFAAPVVIFDEAMFLPTVSFGAILPVISAQPNPQIWFVGSAVDQTTMEDGVEFARVRERALEGDTDRLAYFEWSLDYESPDHVPAGLDWDAIAESNPAFGIRISSDYIAAEYETLGSREHAVERCGVGDWPATDGSGHQAIPIEKWDSLADDPAAPGARLLDPVCLGFDVTPDRTRSAIVAVGRREDKLAQFEVIGHEPGTKWVIPRLVELAERHEPVAIMCDPAGPAGSLVHQALEAGLRLELVDASAYGKAFSLLLDKVEERGLRHLGNADLRAAVSGGTKRPIGDGVWGWGRKNSMVDLTPLVAGTLALWGFSTIGWDGEVAIY